MIALTNSTLFASSLIQKRGISLLAFWKEYTSFFLPSCYNKGACVFFQSKVTSSVDNMDSSLPFLSSTFCCGISLPLFGILFLSTDLPLALKQVSIPFLLQTKIKSNTHLFLNYFLFHLLPYLLAGKKLLCTICVFILSLFALFSTISNQAFTLITSPYSSCYIITQFMCQKSNRYSPFFNLLDFSSLKFC